jgi:hypothetical protein
VVRELNPYETDVVFIIDSSSRVGQRSYTAEKEFIKSVSRPLNVYPGKSRAAVVTYGNTASRVVDFGSPSRTVAEFERSVDAAPVIGGERRMDKGLEKAADVLAEARPNVTKIALLLTSGRQLSLADRKELERVTKRLRDVGVKVFVLSIGNELTTQELLQYVDRKEDIIRLDSFDVLQPVALPTARQIMGNSGKYCYDNCLVMYLSHYDVVIPE